MWTLFIFVIFIIKLAECQNGRDTEQHDHHGHGWDIRLAVPGEPGSDYPTLNSIPRTTFSCAGKEPGYYADLETNCQVFRVCTVGSTYGFQSFLCPNGTLFNQAVFVCDWWMNVNCEKSEQLFENNNERFGNLRLGPQLMKDIKKMLTHPMRNPYDRNSMKSNLIVMQDYKPPSGQLFPNGALLAHSDRNPSNIYVPAKQIQSITQNIYNDNNDIAFAASTPEPRYLPSAFNTIQPSSVSDAEVFQRQRQNGQYVQRNNLSQKVQNQPGNIISNGQNGRITQTTNSIFSNNDGNTQVIRPTQNYNHVNSQFGWKQKNNIAANFNTPNTINIQRGQINGQNLQYTDSKKFSQINSGKQLDFGTPLSRQRNDFNSNQQRQAYSYNTPSSKLSNELIGQNEVKQNLVSTKNAVSPTIIAKTLTFSRLVEDPKPGKPKSRITVKTWIVKPSKSAKLINPTPYTYNRPTQNPAEKIIGKTTPYVYNKPITFSQIRRITEESEQPYVYTKPTVASKQIFTTPVDVTQTYQASTSPRPTLSSRLYLAPTVPAPTKASRLYLTPTTFKPAARYYLPPSENDPETPVILARQYLPPVNDLQHTYYASEQLKAAPTTSAPQFETPTTQNSNVPSFSLTKQSHINTKHNNLTFADILTKEKLDITVSDIVQDTSKILNNASPAQFGQLKQDITALDSPINNYLPPEESGENLTPQTPEVKKSSRIIDNPSIDLEPPIETHNNNQITNQFSNLPFYKEPLLPTNTIERTVSLKISIPEKVASYLFKRRNESDYDKLEILNTGSSNYLVLTNNIFSKNTDRNFIPIGRLIEDKNSNISNSQALVFSLLADSINVAKEFNNIAQQDVTSTSPLQSQFQGVNNEELARITNKISQLTSSQYATNLNSPNIISTAQATYNANNQYNENHQYATPASQQMKQIQHSERFQSGTNNQNSNNYDIYSNQKQIYSGQLYQLPVPDVTSQIYNRPSSKKNDANTNMSNTKNAEFEIVRSQEIPISSGKLQIAPTQENEADTLLNQENIKTFLNTENGISAQVQDKIVGTLTHPIERNKLVNYKKNQSYYVYTKFDDTVTQNYESNRLDNIQKSNVKLAQNTNIPDIVTFQFVPSISYQLEDEKEQQKILNAFQIDEFGNPKHIDETSQSNQGREILTSNINYSVDHTPQSKQVSGQYNDHKTLYRGPSSYSAPQSSIGNLRTKEMNTFNSRLELEPNNGYSRELPAQRFTF